MSEDEVLQTALQIAHEQGAIIVFNRKVNPHEWIEISEPAWDFTTHEYRVAYNSNVQFMFSNFKAKDFAGLKIIDNMSTTGSYFPDNINLVDGWKQTGVICFIYQRDSGKLLDCFVCR